MRNLPISVWCDGAIEEGGNPGGHGVGAWIIKEGSMFQSDKPSSTFEVLSIGTVDLGKYPTLSSNVVEYTAVKYALLDLLDRKWNNKVVQLYTDSKLVVEQLNSVYSCNSPTLLVLRNEIWKMCESFENLTFMHVPRTLNKEADFVSRTLY